MQLQPVSESARGPIQHLIKSAASIKTPALSGRVFWLQTQNYSIKLAKFLVLGRLQLWTQGRGLINGPTSCSIFRLQTLEPNWYVMVDKAVEFPGIVSHSMEGMNTNYTSNVRFKINQEMS